MERDSFCKSLEDLEGEIWKDIQGYEGMYQVSNLGRVKSLNRFVACKFGSKRRCSQKIMSLIKDRDNYCRVMLRNGSEAKKFGVHRLVAKSFLKNENNLPFVNHKNNIHFDNEVNNLEWCDHEYNVHHYYDILKAHKDYCKLSEEDVKYIRDNYVKGDSRHNIGNGKELSIKFNVSMTTISCVARGDSYKNKYGKSKIRKNTLECRKLNVESVRWIRENYISGKVGMAKEFSIKFGVSKSAIHNVVSRRKWKNI